MPQTSVNPIPIKRKATSILKEFKKFAVRGNAVDLAVGVIIGAAFGKIVTSLVNDILTPIIGAIIGNIDFTNRFIALNGAQYASLADAKASSAPVLTYGNFIQNVVDFLLIAVIIFLVVKVVNKLAHSEPVPKSIKLTRDQELLTEIRDSLKQHVRQ
jgi:large conductance mechanosensitive channel